MQEDFVAELGYLALAVRLKRISEAMIHSGRSLYKTLKIDIEPNWFLLFKLLKKYEELSITQIAELLKFSHPSIIAIVCKMKEKGYLESSSDTKDSRKQLIKLSEKAIKILPKLEEVWSAGTKSIQNMFTNDDNFLDQLFSIESQYRKKDFMERTLNQLKCH